MDRDYLRSLGPKLVVYFERLAKSQPTEWSDCLSFARDFAALVARDEDEWRKGATELRRKLALLQSQGGSALCELEHAIEDMIGNCSESSASET
jgi:hypothetical protein